MTEKITVAVIGLAVLVVVGVTCYRIQVAFMAASAALCQ